MGFGTDSISRIYSNLQEKITIINGSRLDLSTILLKHIDIIIPKKIKYKNGKDFDNQGDRFLYNTSQLRKLFIDDYLEKDLISIKPKSEEILKIEDSFAFLDTTIPDIGLLSQIQKRALESRRERGKSNQKPPEFLGILSILSALVSISTILAITDLKLGNFINNNTEDQILQGQLENSKTLRLGEFLQYKISIEAICADFDVEVEVINRGKYLEIRIIKDKSDKTNTDDLLIQLSHDRQKMVDFFTRHKVDILGIHNHLITPTEYKGILSPIKNPNGLTQSFFVKNDSLKVFSTWGGYSNKESNTGFKRKLIPYLEKFLSKINSLGNRDMEIVDGLIIVNFEFLSDTTVKEVQEILSRFTHNGVHYESIMSRPNEAGHSYHTYKLLAPSFIALTNTLANYEEISKEIEPRRFKQD